MRGIPDKIDDMLDEANLEHAVAKDLIPKIEAGDPDVLDASFKVLAEYVGRHVEEEEGEIFVAVVKTKVDLNDGVCRRSKDRF